MAGTNYVREAEDRHQRARELWEGGRHEEALRAWQEALSLDPGHAEALTSLAWALGQLGRPEEGAQVARRALDLLGDEPRARRVAGELCFLQGHYEAALKHYRRALAALAERERRDEDWGPLRGLLHRDAGDACYMLDRFREAAREYEQAVAAGVEEAYCRLWLGWARLRLDDRRGARREFGRACELAPDWHEPFYAAGYLRCAEGDFEEAAGYLGQALGLLPEDDDEARAATACELGNARRGLGDLSGAVALYQEALSLDPTHAVARFNLGLALLERGDLEEAISAFRVAAQLDPEDEEILLELGRACAEAGRFDEALEAYQRALRLSPESADAFSGLGMAYFGLGVHESAAEHYARAVELRPGDPRARFNLAVTLEAAGRHAEADRAMEEAWRLGQEEPDLCIAIARALTSHGRDPEGAARAARQACLLDPESADAHDALAVALLSAGHYQAAIGPAQEAVRLMPEAADYHFSLGLALEASGGREQARGHFQRALALSPDFEEAREALRRLEESG